jgi:hypothetical protein
MTYTPGARDRQQVETMVGLGFPAKDIALVMKVSVPTLRKHFAAELRLGQVKANVTVANNLYRLATRENPSAVAVIFWLKTRAGWREAAPEAVPGKKEQAELDARIAEKGTDWAGLLH